MADFFWFSDEQWDRIAPLLPNDVRGMKRVDDRRVLSGIVHALQSGGRWSDCPEHVYGPKKTLYNRLKRWADRGVWERIFADLAGVDGVPSKLFIDSSCIKVHRTAGGGKGGPWLMVSARPKVVATPSSTASATRRGVPTSSC
jgi:mannitol 2-dehydrogenase